MILLLSKERRMFVKGHPFTVPKLKKRLFQEIAFQGGDFFDENVLTIVRARRFAADKRLGLINPGRLSVFGPDGKCKISSSDYLCGKTLF